MALHCIKITETKIKIMMVDADYDFNALDEVATNYYKGLIKLTDYDSTSAKFEIMEEKINV